MNATEVGMQTATSDEDVIPPQIEELLSDRATLVGWLERLGNRRDDVRPAVYEKVRDDYRERLEEVEEHLSEHRSDLEAALSERREAVGEIEEEREERAAELEEAELRHAVGELEEDEWEEESAELREALDELDEGLQAERGAVRKLEDVLDQLTSLEEGAAVDVDVGPPAGGRETTGGAPEPESGWSKEPATDEPDAEATEPETGAAPRGGDAKETTGREEAPRAADEEPAIEGGDGWPAPELADSEPSESGAAAAEANGGDRGDDGEEPSDERPAAGAAAADGEAGDDFDELDFLESLSLDEPDSLDTLGMELDEDEEASDGESAGEEDREGPGG